MSIKRIYVRRYSDNGQVTAYVEHDKGRTESTAHWHFPRHGRPAQVTFGEYMHQALAQAHAQGLRLERETW
jgi:hypothetical protein